MLIVFNKLQMKIVPFKGFLLFFFFFGGGGVSKPDKYHHSLLYILITIEISFSFSCAIVDAITNKKTLLELHIVFNEAQTTLWPLEALGFVIPTPVYQLIFCVILASLIGRQKHSTFFFPDCGH